MNCRMEKHNFKRLYALVLAYVGSVLWSLVKHIQGGVGLVWHYVDVVAKRPLVLKLKMCIERTSRRPWFKKCRNALGHCAAFIVGSTYVDERVEFTARMLVKNDAYRDRLLVPEIEDLVALCDALRFTLPQRKAYFQCFLHVDFMRRSSVSRAELLRYCSLRSTALTSFLLPNAEEATHRETARNRWDIIQLMAACFSLCTTETAELVRLAVVEAIRLPEYAGDEDGKERSTSDEIGEEKLELMLDKQMIRVKPLVPNICQQIDQCLSFFIGVLDPVEQGLQTLLSALYKSELDNEQPPHASFQEIHGVTTIFDVARLFPVLIFPCIWAQRVLRKRIIGVKTWQCLERRRKQLQPYLPTGSLHLSVADIVASAQVQLQQKTNRDYHILTPTSDNSSARLRGNFSSRSDDSGSSRRSTSCRVVPSVYVSLNIVNIAGVVLILYASELAQSDADTSSHMYEELSNLRLTFDQCSTADEAWRVAANHALASVHIQCLLDTSTPTIEELQEEFEQVTNKIFAGKLSVEMSEKIRQRLVKVYGYHFAHSLLSRSNVKEHNHTSKTPSDERRATQRYAKALGGDRLAEDKSIYWKEFQDPVAKRAFYYNVRTGESRWEKPVNFVSKKAKRRRKMKTTETKPEPRSPAGDK
ncbi:hypothetical protein P3T76_006757 [Phytophthora citrophthora]|uniref:WW domain-containing protein n=1 Tax=Phytophthora citrophthora TaxID=4793 RepID=A0AAD9LLU0_9STRA|nr:hypothetical protein P3T76_006757 [Phytophthora citrophthora]